jgi:hypothetical protein
MFDRALTLNCVLPIGPPSYSNAIQPMLVCQTDESWRAYRNAAGSGAELAQLAGHPPNVLFGSASTCLDSSFVCYYSRLPYVCLDIL